MSTTKTGTFSDMLNEYLVYSNILEETFRDQNWLMKNANLKKTWQGGKLIVPFQQSYASSVSMGGLSADDDIDNATYVRGYIDGYKECYGALYFNSRDLNLDHFVVSEQNFLKLLPDQLEQLLKYMKQTVSIQVLNGGYLDDCGTPYTGTTDGLLTVKHPERFMIGQKLLVVDTTPALTVTTYVRAINKNTAVLTCYDARTGGALEDFTGIDATSKIYIDGGNTTQFGSLKDMLLPAASGGSDSFANKLKVSSPFAQSVLYDAGGAGGGGDWGATPLTGNGILTMIFDSLRKAHQLGAEPNVYIMSYTNYCAAILAVEKNSGVYKNIVPAVDYAGYSEMTVGGMHGTVSLVGIREMGDDWMAGIKKEFLDFHCGNKAFQVMKSPDGLAYYTKRATSGYTYITDIQFAGDFLYRHPWSAVGVHNIPAISIPAIT